MGKTSATEQRNLRDDSVRRVRLDGVEIAYRDTGAPAEGHSADSAPRPALLLHGWPQDRGIWNPVIAAMAGERRLIAPDLRGFGESQAPATATTAPPSPPIRSGCSTTWASSAQT